MRQGSILIVDDDPVVVQMLGRMLTELGEVRFALSGVQGLQMAREQLPDIILLDAEMPGMDGYEVCRALKADQELSAIPVIFVTSHDDNDSEVRGLEAGAVDFIGKPPRPGRVLARVRTHLQLKQATDELMRCAHTDALTGLANRRQFDRCLEREWDRARRAASPMSLLMLDIDHFKQFNDHYGHQEGDRCLQVVAQSIQLTIRRPADEVARIGGEEFVVLLPDTDADGAVHMGRRLIDSMTALAWPHSQSPSSDHVTLSIGAATAPFHLMRDGAAAFGGNSLAASQADLLQCADKALYQAKEMGRNDVRFMMLDLGGHA